MLGQKIYLVNFTREGRPATFAEYCNLKESHSSKCIDVKIENSTAKSQLSCSLSSRSNVCMFCDDNEGVNTPHAEDRPGLSTQDWAQNI